MDFFQVIDPVTLQPQGFMRSAIELVLVVVVGCLLCRYVQVGAARLSKNVAGGSKIKPAPTSKGGFGAPPTGDLDDEGLSLKPKDIRSPVVDKSKEVTNAFIVPKPSTSPASNVHHRKPQVDDVPMSPLGSTTNPPSVSSTAAPTRATSIDSFNVKNTSITTPATLTEVKKPLPETSEASHNHKHVPLNKAHGSASQPATAQAPAADSLLDNVLDELFDDEDMLDDALLAATEGSAKDKEVSAETKKGDDKKGGNTQPPTQRPQQTKTAASNPPVSATAPPAVNSSNKTTTVQPAKVDDEEDGMFAEMKRKKLAKQKAQQEQATAATAAVPSATNTASKMTVTPLPSTTKNSQQTEERKAKATMDLETKTAPTASSTNNNNANPPSADHLLDNTLDEVFDDEALLDEALTHATSS